MDKVCPGRLLRLLNSDLLLTVLASTERYMILTGKKDAICEWVE